MNADKIAAYVRQNGKTTQIIEDTGDAENGPNLSVSPEFKRLGPLFLFEDVSGIVLTLNISGSQSSITLIDTMPQPIF